MQSSHQPLLSLPMRKKLNLLDLPEEILSVLSRCVWALPPNPRPSSFSGEVAIGLPDHPTLKGLSRTCKKLRRITAQDLFRLVNIGRLVVTYFATGASEDSDSEAEEYHLIKIDYQELD